MNYDKSEKSLVGAKPLLTPLFSMPEMFSYYRKYSYSILRASCKTSFLERLGPVQHLFSVKPSHDTWSNLTFISWLLPSRTSRQSPFSTEMTVMTAGHFLVQSLLRRLKLGAERWGWLRQAWQNTCAHIANKDTRSFYSESNPVTWTPAQQCVWTCGNSAWLCVFSNPTCTGLS